MVNTKMPLAPTTLLSLKKQAVAAKPGTAPEVPAVSDRVRLQNLQALETPKKAIETLVDDLGYSEFPQVSPDGETLTFNVVGDYTTSQLMTVSSKGGQVRALETGAEIDEDNLYDYLSEHKGSIREQATWTPDGKGLLFRTNQNGTFDIGHYDLEQKSSRLVAENPELNLKHPVQLENGNILFYGGRPSEERPTSDLYSNIFIAEKGTGAQKQLTHSTGETAYKHPAPLNGKVVAHLEDKGKDDIADLVTIDPKTGEQTALTDTPTADERHPFYNEKVNLLVYHRKEDGDKNLVLSTTDGKKTAQLTFYGRPAQSPCWSPDGRKIYFIKKAKKKPDMEHFYERTADVRVLDVKTALKDLEEQAEERMKKLEKSGAESELVDLAREQLENYQYFLRRY